MFAMAASTLLICLCTLAASAGFAVSTQAGFLGGGATVLSGLQHHRDVLVLFRGGKSATFDWCRGTRLAARVQEARPRCFGLAQLFLRILSLSS